MIAEAKVGDLAEMLAISNDAAERTAANFATTPELIADWRQAFDATHAVYPHFVDVERGRVVGFAKAAPHRGHRARGAYRWACEVSVYIAPDRHGQRVGNGLYSALIPTLRAQGYTTLLAGITLPNPASERLHESFKFSRCGTYHRVGFKLGVWHDVGQWELHLQPEGEAPLPIRAASDVWPKVRALAEGALEVSVEPLDCADAQALIDGANSELSRTYPEPGATHFQLDAAEVSSERGSFLIARIHREAIGCGAVRPSGDGTFEIKRMYTAPRWRGLGVSRRILDRLEAEASRLGARRVVLETGARQAAALALYARAGYARCAAFGEYVDSPLSVCFEKSLVT